MGKCLSSCVRDTDIDRAKANGSTNSNLHSAKKLPQQQSSLVYEPNRAKLDKKNSAEITSITRRTSPEIKKMFFLSKPEYDETKIEALFNKYRDDSEDAILTDGMEKFCQDLGVDPTEYIVLLIAWKFSAAQMCRFTKKEFVEGFKLIKVDSLKGLHNKFPELLREVESDAEKFKDLYRFTFKFGLDSEEGQRSLPIGMAIPLWKLLFTKNPPDLMERWYEFLEEHEVRGISRDTWNMFLNFTESIKSDFSNYDDTEAWPSLFDYFVDCEREKMKQSLNGECGNTLDYSCKR